MKKTKIILPAIALLAISGAASVTGTVAWFTASQSVDLTASNISAISTSGDLTAKIKAGTGVATENQSSGTNAGYINGKAFELYDLCDSSYNATSKKFYKAVMDSDNDAEANTVTGYSEISNGHASSYISGGNTKKVFYAAQWQVTFGTEATYGTYSLFFDARAAKSNLNDGAENPAAVHSEIFNSFRVAMHCGTETIVWAPNGTEKTYVASETTTASYADSVFLAGNSASHFTSASTEADAKNDVTFLASGLTASSSKTVDFVAWFEGTDSDCITDNANNVASVEAATLAMSFYAVSWSAGA